MEQLPENIVKEIDEAVGGNPLTQDQIQTFQTALSDFVIAYRDDMPEMDDIINDIAMLLTVSVDNIDKVQSDNWFSRAWHTINGRNNRLLEANRQNLVVIQKGALMFLRKLGQQNEALMISVASAWSRVDKLRMQNERLKAYMIEFTYKLNVKLEGIEKKLNTHDKDISSMYKSNKSKGLIQTIAGIVLLVVAGVLLLSTDKSNVVVITSIVSGLLGLFVLASGIKTNSNKRPSETDNRDDRLSEKIRLRNRKVLAETRDNMSKYLSRSNQDLNYAPFETLVHKYKQFFEPEFDKDHWTHLDKQLQVEPDFVDDMVTGIYYFAHEYARRANYLLSSFIKKYLPESSGLELRCIIGQNKIDKLFNDIYTEFEPQIEQFRSMASIKEQLFVRYPKFRREVDGHLITNTVKLIVSSLQFRDPLEFYNEYTRDYHQYKRMWQSARYIHLMSLRPIMERHSELFSKECSDNFEPLFLEFDSQNVELSRLNKELTKMIKDIDRKEAKRKASS